MLKAALYARVSSEEQARKENSIPAQLRALRDHCKRNNIEIYDEYTDEAITGQIGDRPAFQRMLSDAYAGKVNVILVHKFDRFARKVELSRTIKNKLKASLVNVVSITEPIEDSPMGFFMEGLYELMAEYYVRNLSAEVYKGMNERALKGKHMGQMPYGYYVKDKQVFIDESQAATVRKIYQKYDEGWGHAKIAMWLNDSMVPTYKGIIGGWQTFQVSQILKNMKYIGKNKWNGVVYDAVFPSILDEEVFYRVQSKTEQARKKHAYKGDNYAIYPLLGLLHCGECGKLMRIKYSTSPNGNRTYHYMCRDASLYRSSCDFRKRFNARKMEENVEAYIESILSGATVNLVIQTDSQPKEIEDTAKKQIEKIDTELKRAKNAYLNGVFDLEEFREIKAELEKRKKILSAEADQIPDTAASDAEQYQILLKKIKSAWDLYKKVKTAEEKRTILSTFIRTISIYRDRWEVIFYI